MWNIIISYLSITPGHTQIIIIIQLQFNDLARITFKNNVLITNNEKDFGIIILAELFGADLLLFS